MEFEKMPTVPTADEILDRSFRRAAKKMKEKTNKERANEEFVRAVGAAVHDRLVYIIRGFPEFDDLPPFYRELADILYGVERIKMSLGAVGWAAKHTKMIGNQLAVQSRKAADTLIVRKRAVARLASMVHQIDKDLHFLNEVRNVLRHLPNVEEAYTIVIQAPPATTTGPISGPIYVAPVSLIGGTYRYMVLDYSGFDGNLSFNYYF